MNRKAKKSKKSSSRHGASKLKPRRSTVKGKSSSRKKRSVSVRKGKRRPLKKAAIAKSRSKGVALTRNRIVRIMGHGQFTVDSKTLRKLDELDNTIVEMVSMERSDDNEFRKKLTELNSIVVKEGKPLDPHEIIQSDIILPSDDLSIDEAKKLFREEGVIPEI